MTLAEIVRECEGITFRYTLEQKNRAQFDYTLALLIGSATVGQLGKNNKFPTIEEAYPNLFNTEEHKEEIQQKKADASTARFLQFAKQFNQKFKREDNKINEFRDNECQTECHD